MTETEWLACEDWERMLGFLRGRVDDRKLRLFGCACCRRLWPLLGDRSRMGVQLSEQYADGWIGQGILSRASEAARAAWNEATYSGQAALCAADAAYRVMWDGFDDRVFADEVEAMQYVVARMIDATDQSKPQAGGELSDVLSLWRRHAAWEGGVASRLIAEIFGNPFRPAPLAAAYRTPVTISLGVSAYAEWATPTGHLDPARLSVLSDALEEAGCTDDAILTHLRSPGPHVRGCWALDLILGKQ